MNCKSCGAPLVDGDQFCKNCGAPVDNAGVQPNDTMNDVGGFGAQDTNMAGIDNINTMNSMNDQNMYSGQPMYEQPMTNNMGSYDQPSMPPKQSGGNTKFIIVAIVAIVAICATIFLAMTMNKSNSESSSDNSGGDTAVVPANNGGGSEESTYSAKIGDFTVKVPTDVLSENSGKKLVIGDSKTWAATIQVLPANFAALKANKSQLPSKLQSMGYTAKNLKDDSYDGYNMITVEVSNGTVTEILAYSQANASNVFGLEVIEDSNTPNYERLKTIVKILKTATYEPSSNSISFDSKVDLGGIASSVAK